MGLFLQSTQLKRIFIVSALLAFISGIFLIASILIIRSIFISHIRLSLNDLAIRIKNDLRYENNKWDTTLYTADPLTPHPTGSSGFVTPLYIITTDGFVIERNQPISGLLDTSDYKRLLTFKEPQTINAITNESWRILAKPIIKDETSFGVAMVSYFNPIPASQEEIDTKLEDNLSRLQAQLYVKDNQLMADKLDIRKIDYDISFEVVDTFNTVIANNGRNPSFIDPSYIASIIKSKNEEIKKDGKTGEKFLFKRMDLYDSNNTVRAVIVAGESIDYIDSGLSEYLPYAVGLLVITNILSILFITRIFSVPKLIKQAAQTQIVPKSVTFNAEEGVLLINDKSYSIPLNSHQYKILHALFSAPNKIWQQSELFERFHEDGTQENTRKIYDAMLAINKKSGFKLILYKEKTYQLDQNLLN